MPPVPRPGKTAAPKAGAGNPRQFRAEREGNRPEEKSPAPESIPRAQKTTPTERKLEENIVIFYQMMGTILRPFGRFIPVLDPLGTAMRDMAKDAGQAWMELARQDPAWKKRLEQWTSASAYGNVIGVHFAMVMNLSQVNSGNPQGPGPMDDPIAWAKSMGLSDNDIENTLKNMGYDTGGPGDTVRTGGTPVEPIQNVQAKEQSTAKKNGIVTEQELGVSNPGEEYSNPMRTGGISE